MFLSWVVIARLYDNAYETIIVNDYIKVEQNAGFLKTLGVKSARAYQPWLILPRIDVWQEVQRLIVHDLQGRATGRSSVLRLANPGETVERTFTFTVRFYRPNILAIEATLKDEIQQPITDAFNLRQLDNHPAAYAVVDSLIGIIKTGSTRGYQRNNSFFSRPAILLPLDVTKQEFEIWKTDNKSVVANLLINNPNYDVASSKLAEAIFSRNQDVNVKFESGGFSLVSKQGIVTAYSKISDVFSRYMLKEHIRRARFLELALALREFISEFTACRQKNEDIADFMFYLGRPLISEVSNLPNTMTGAYVWQILSNELGFKIAVDTFDKHLIDEVDKKTEYILKIKENDYHALDFAKKVKAELGRSHQNWLEKVYGRHKAVFWIIGVLATAAGVAARILFR